VLGGQNPEPWHALLTREHPHQQIDRPAIAEAHPCRRPCVDRARVGVAAHHVDVVALVEARATIIAVLERARGLVDAHGDRAGGVAVACRRAGRGAALAEAAEPDAASDARAARDERREHDRAAEAAPVELDRRVPAEDLDPAQEERRDGGQVGGPGELVVEQDRADVHRRRLAPRAAQRDRRQLRRAAGAHDARAGDAGQQVRAARARALQRGAVDHRRRAGRVRRARQERALDLDLDRLVVVGRGRRLRLGWCAHQRLQHGRR
jgi:hypothetical protein